MLQKYLNTIIFAIKKRRDKNDNEREKSILFRY